MKRSPFPIPFGWFQVGWPDDVAVGEVKPSTSAGTWCCGATSEGQPHLQDAFCPHLGAHLGHGGKVVGCEIACPFHGWRFDADGQNTLIPYSERTNAKGKLGTYPTIERNGLLMAWYHPVRPSPDVGDPRGPRVQRPRATSPPMVTRRTTSRRAVAGARRERRRLGPLPLRAQHRGGARSSTATRPTARSPSMRSIAEVPDAARRGRRSHRRRQLRPGLLGHPLLRHRRHRS